MFVERAQRRIPVELRQAPGRPPHDAGQTTHLPFKLNMSGVIPPIFASSLLLFPATIAGFGGAEQRDLVGAGAAERWRRPSATASRCTSCFTRVLIVFFCFFYTALVFNSRETADNLKKSGAFIPGIRPGQQTGEYIDKVLTRLTVWGALYITAVCLLPELLMSRAACRSISAAPRCSSWSWWPWTSVAASGPPDVAPLSGFAQEGEPRVTAAPARSVISRV